MKCRLITRGMMMVVAGLACLAFCGEHNSASGLGVPTAWWHPILKYPTVNPRDFVPRTSLTKVKVRYTYYVWETRTRYRWVTKPVTTTSYRTEWRTTRERYRDWRGRWRIRYRRKPVRVPFRKTVYKKVRQRYTVRIRVKKTGYRYEYRNNQKSL